MLHYACRKSSLKCSFYAPQKTEGGNAWLVSIPWDCEPRRRRGETDGRGGRHQIEGAKQFFSPLGASQDYSTNRSDREFYLSPWPICAVALKFSLRKVFWIIRAAILIQLLHHRVGANGGASLSGVQSPSSSYLKWVHPEYTCCNRDIPGGGESKLSKWQKLC